MVVCSLNQHYVLLQCNLVYTGLTRGKLVVLIGQKKALGIAVRNDRTQRRNSGLILQVRINKGT